MTKLAGLFACFNLIGSLPLRAADESDLETLSCVLGAEGGLGRENGSCHDGNTKPMEKRAVQECKLYLAESSIPNAGLGIYTAVDVMEGEYVGDSEVLVPIIDKPHDDWWLLDEVQWGSDLFEEVLHETPLQPGYFYPGFGAAINCHMGLNNVEHVGVSSSFDSAELHRSRDPGTGAFSNYHNIRNIASVDIASGSELFTNYGEAWFTDREEWLGAIPLEEDFDHADNIVKKATNMKQRMEDDMWNLVRSIVSDRVKVALPPSTQNLEQAAALGTARVSLQNSIRSIEWLQENGSCIDNILPGQSRIRQAGRGAYAKRFIPEGTVIAPAPLLQLYRGRMTVFETADDEESDEIKITDKKVRPQLLMNYAFGHPNSSVLLLPYGPVVNLINHNGTAPNARIQWSDSRLHKKEFLEMSAEAVLDEYFGLMMEYVALRDILAGEEIYLDYGDDWEEAWSSHVQNWVPPPGSADYVTANQMNQRQFDLRTEEEQVEMPYPPNLQTACDYDPTVDAVDAFTSFEGDGDDDSGDDEHTWVTKGWEDTFKGCPRTCKIRSRFKDSDGEEYFSAEMLDGYHMDTHCFLPDGERHIVSNIPRKMLSFQDRIYTRDQALRNAFRHEIGLPDGVFPAAWMDMMEEDVYERF